MTQQKHSFDFGKKEKVLDYACLLQFNPVRDSSSVENRNFLATRMPSGMRTNKMNKCN